MQLLDAHARHYAWGSRTLIPELKGEEPGTRPVAELWFGAHPANPSTIGGRRLDDIIAAAPEAMLGAEVCAKFDGRLPFLMKILAAGEPLSLQAHPTPEQARDGFEREDAAGIALDDPKRNYKDTSHKPEIIIALTDFYAMAGFRPLEQTRELFAALNCDGLAHYESMLVDSPEAEESNLRVLFTTWITIPAAIRTKLIEDVTAAAHEYVGSAEPGDWIAGVLRTVIALQEQYPGDPGVLGALLLNHIQLSPGEAVYLDAGELHAYVRGMGVEVMANSDNVLRGGLTSKHVDVPELVRVLNFEALPSPRVEQEDLSQHESLSGGAAWGYPVPIDEFSVVRCELSGDDSVELASSRPGIVLCTAGRTVIEHANPQAGPDPVTLSPGQAVWLPANAAPCRASVGEGAESTQLFIARA